MSSCCTPGHAMYPVSWYKHTSLINWDAAFHYFGCFEWKKPNKPHLSLRTPPCGLQKKRRDKQQMIMIWLTCYRSKMFTDITMFFFSNQHELITWYTHFLKTSCLKCNQYKLDQSLRIIILIFFINKQILVYSNHSDILMKNFKLTF